MSKKTKESLKIVSQERIGKDIYSMWLQADHMAAEAKPGQFLSLYTRDGSKLLPRPISICEIDRENGRIRLVYRVTGKNTGTEAFSRLHAGVPVEVLGPLGMVSLFMKQRENAYFSWAEELVFLLCFRLQKS